MSVTVDGALFGTVDLYRANPPSTSDVADFNTAIVPRERIPLALGLADAVHSVTLKVLATRNGGSSGNNCRVDAVELLRQRQAGQVLESAAPVQSVQSGIASCVLAGASSGGTAVTFSPAFPNGAPRVICSSAYGTFDYVGFSGSITASGCIVYAGRRDGTSVNATVPVHWLAIG